MREFGNEFLQLSPDFIKAANEAATAWADEQAAQNEWFKKAYDHRRRFQGAIKGALEEPVPLPARGGLSRPPDERRDIAAMHRGRRSGAPGFRFGSQQATDGAMETLAEIPCVHREADRAQLGRATSRAPGNSSSGSRRRRGRASSKRSSASSSSVRSPPWPAASDGRSCVLSPVPFIRSVEWFTRLFGYIGASIISALIIAMVYEVISRYFFSAPTKWAFEMAYMLMGTSFMFGLAYCMQMGGTSGSTSSTAT